MFNIYIISIVEMNEVKSSNISSIGWNKNILRVEFNKGGVWDYSGVSKEIYEDFLNSESKGKFFLQKIRNKFKAKKIED